MNRSEFKELNLQNHFPQHQSDYNPQDTYLWQSVQPQNLNSINDMLINENRRGSDVRSLIETLMKTKKPSLPSLSLAQSTIQPALVRTQQRIFQQIVNLICEIGNIKQQIQQQQTLTIRLQSQRNQYSSNKKININIPINNNNKAKIAQKKQHVSKKTNGFHQYDSIINKLKSKPGQINAEIEESELLRPQSSQNFQKLQKQNEKLQKNIQNLRNKSKFSSKSPHKNRNTDQKFSSNDVLRQQKQRYNYLYRKLADKSREMQENTAILQGGDTDQLLQQQIRRLHNDINRIQYHQQQQSSDNYNSDNTQHNSKLLIQQMQYLNTQNQSLRDKTVRILQNSKQSKAGINHHESSTADYQLNKQIQQLKQFIKSEDSSKNLFMEQLKKFKKQYQRLKEQNQQLKRRSTGGSSKRFNNGSIVRNNVGNYGRNSGVKSKVQTVYRSNNHRQSNNTYTHDKLSEYANIVNQMKRVQK